MQTTNGTASIVTSRKRVWRKKFSWNSALFPKARENITINSEIVSWFPIINTAGRVIGFGGRAIGDAQPKYLNSPENKVFQKKNNLYALNICKQDIGRQNSAILVEGYMDVISLYQAGVRNAIASLGTALTENQARLIKRYTKNVILSYDADQAGRKAAMRGIDVLSGQDCKVKVLHVTDGKDPDEFIKQHGKDAFLALTEKALPMIDYKLDSLKQNINLGSEEGKSIL